MMTGAGLVRGARLPGATPPTGVAPDVLVGTETGDDAGVLRLRDELGLIVTADYITPPLDDPFAYGQIAAANSLSDVYAMGGVPRTALNLCVFPRELAPAVAQEILAGAAEVAARAGAPILGGHTVRGPELLFGLSVTGTVHPGRIWRNVGAQPGDVLLLTKPLGTGLLVSGYRRGLRSLDDMREVVAGMTTLNQAAHAALAELPVHAATDVTGFGLVGHALGMTQGGVTLRIRVGALPVYGGALALAARGVTCAGAKANRAAYAGRISGIERLPGEQLELLHDPQTSGGLLLALPPEAGAAARAALQARGVLCAEIGVVVAGPPGLAVDE